FSGDGNVSFNEAQFSGNGDVSFNNVRFNSDGDVSFDSLVFANENKSFNGGVSFERTQFTGIVSFANLQETETIKSFSFKHASFEKSLTLPNSTFSCVLDLTDTKLGHSVTLHNLDCKLNRERQFEKLGFYKAYSATDEDDAARFRRLKEIAVANKDHDRALAFHGEELRAKRWHDLTFFQSMVNAIYSGISNYGQSLINPFLGMIFLLIASIIMHSHFAECYNFWTAFNYSSSNIVPFLSSAKSAASDNLKILYPESTGGVPEWLYIVTLITQLFNYILIFLFGLALRNKFKM
ncbi:MAG: hypothetical protein HRU28_18765, partial [Rhizobiales bacterium]|nr:hypothetical protein [Hyphomicrobiales bacterium]